MFKIPSFSSYRTYKQNFEKKNAKRIQKYVTLASETPPKHNLTLFFQHKWINS